MNYIIIIIFGFLIGRMIGMIIHKKTNWVDGKAETDLYMKKKYGSNWIKFNK